MTTSKYGGKNQIITNINYDQNSFTFWNMNNQTKMALDKTYTEETNLYFLTKTWDFSSIRPGNKSTRNEQKSKV